MANTTNFGWETPDDTDLVKDGAAAIRTLGSAIDTSLVDLKGGTTGQVLSKATNTDMDFTWVAQDDSNAIQNAIVDAKGDLISATAADTPARLAVGTNGHVLTADSTASTGLKWAAAASGGMTELASGSLSGSSISLDVSGQQSYNDLILDITGAVWSANANVGIRVNALTSSYGYVYYGNSGNTATNQATGAGESYWIAGDGGALPSASDTYKRYRFIFPMYSLTSGTLQMFGFYSWGNENSTRSNAIIIGSQATADNIDTIIFRTSGGQTFSAGTYKLWGVK